MPMDVLNRISRGKHRQQCSLESALNENGENKKSHLHHVAAKTLFSILRNSLKLFCGSQNAVGEKKQECLL
jgi:hypothetical protein